MMKSDGEEGSHVNPVRSAFVTQLRGVHSLVPFATVAGAYFGKGKTVFEYFIRSLTPRQYGGLNLIFFCDARGSAI